VKGGLLIKHPSELNVTILAGGRRARLNEPFRMRAAGGRVFEVPAGFETDFASVPRFFWRVLPPWDKYSPAAVVHDHLYQTGKVPRVEADKTFLELMEALGVSWWKRRVMYYAVRAFGWIAWNRHRRKPGQ